MEIPLTQGKIALIDDEDWPLVAGYRWSAACGSAVQVHHYYARTWVRRDGKRYGLMMHRLLIGPGYAQVDHINGESLDNRRSNLRGCTAAQNGANKGVGRRNRSGFKGVSFRQREQRWAATVSLERQDRWLGYFSTPEDAARAYDAAARELHGEFARLNFP